MLSPDIVVERKALPDLFASLGSGRLYNQVRLHRVHSHSYAANDMSGDLVQLLAPVRAG